MPGATVSARVWSLVFSTGEIQSDSITIADLALQPGLHLRDDEVNASLFA